MIFFFYQISWVLSEKERDRRYNKLKKVGHRNDFFRNSTSDFRQNNLTALTLVQAPEIHVRP